MSAFSRRLSERRARIHRDGVEQLIAEQDDDLLEVEEELRTQLDALSEVCTQLERERRRYEDLFEHSPIACLVCDRSGAVMEANPAAYALFGASARRLRDQSLVSLMIDGDAARAGSLFDARTPAKLMTTFTRLRGARFVAETSITPLADAHRVLVHVCLVREAATISDGPVTSWLIRRLRDAEELLGRERALRMKLESAARAQHRFIAMLSHDLRAPLSAVLGWTQLLRREALTRSGREVALERIEGGARMQLALVNELLDVSRIESDKLPLELAPIDLADCVRNVAGVLAPVAESAGVSVALHMEDRPVMVFADRTRIGQVVSNLLANAFKFTPSGGNVDIRVRSDGPSAVVEVEDDGRGMSADLVPNVFDCYRQGAAPLSVGAGLGLGLYIVKQVVHLHGGTVEATSQGEGRGSKFTVRLPLRDARAPTRHSPFALMRAGG